jgi:hypothetical protein
MLASHGDYHPAMGRSFSNQVDVAVDDPSSTLSGEAFLERRVTRRTMASRGGGTVRPVHRRSARRW